MAMSKLSSASLITGTAFMVLGSLLPWRMEGDLFSYYTYGLRLFPPRSDYGGFLVLVICAALLVAAFRPPATLPNPRVVTAVLAATLVLLSLYHIAVIWIDHVRSTVIGPPIVQIGLILVFLGSILSLVASLAPLVSRSSPK